MGELSLTVSEHARWQAERRGVDEATLLAVAWAPEQVIPVRPGREIRQSRVAAPSGKKTHLVRVVVDLSPNLATIVTVYRTSRIEKYWRKP